MRTTCRTRSQKSCPELVVLLPQLRSPSGCTSRRTCRSPPAQVHSSKGLAPLLGFDREHANGTLTKLCACKLHQTAKLRDIKKGLDKAHKPGQHDGRQRVSVSPDNNRGKQKNSAVTRSLATPPTPTDSRSGFSDFYAPWLGFHPWRPALGHAFCASKQHEVRRVPDTPSMRQTWLGSSELSCHKLIKRIEAGFGFGSI